MQVTNRLFLTQPEKTMQESRIEEIQRQLGEREDRLHSEHVREWILQLAAEREAKTLRSVKAEKTMKKTSKSRVAVRDI